VEEERVEEERWIRVESRVPLLQCRKWEAQDYKEEDEESV
jgi:hypothetical protein